MISKEMIIQDITHEVKVIKHLADKILPDTHNWKPSESQRTILELLQYLSHIGKSLATMITTGEMTHFGDDAEKSKALTADEFHAAMDTQLTYMIDAISGLTNEDAQQEINFFGGRKATKAYVVLSLLKTIVAYRMQLFLYVKQSGRSELNTANNWMGMDMPPQS